MRYYLEDKLVAHVSPTVVGRHVGSHVYIFPLLFCCELSGFLSFTKFRTAEPDLREGYDFEDSSCRLLRCLMRRSFWRTSSRLRLLGYSNSTC